MVSTEKIRKIVDGEEVVFERISVGVDPVGDGTETVVTVGLDADGNIWVLDERQRRTR